MKKLFVSWIMAILVVVLIGAGCNSIPDEEKSSPKTDIPVTSTSSPAVSDQPVNPASSNASPKTVVKKTASTTRSTSKTSVIKKSPTAVNTPRTNSRPRNETVYFRGLGLTMSLPFAEDDTLTGFSSCGFSTDCRQSDDQDIREGKIKKGEFVFIGRVSKNWSPHVKGFVLESAELSSLPANTRRLSSGIGSITVFEDSSGYYDRIRIKFGLSLEEGDPKRYVAVFTPPQNPTLRVVLVYFADSSLSKEEWEKGLQSMRLK